MKPASRKGGWGLSIGRDLIENVVNTSADAR